MWRARAQEPLKQGSMKQEKNYKIFALHRYVENRSNKYALKIC
jgi:hypothetical protein